VTTFLTAASIIVLVTIAIGFVRVIRGPSKADRLIAAQLFGTAGVAWILLFAYATGKPGLSDVALVLALLAAVSAIAFVKRAWKSAEEEPHESA
jgi:multicomponent Na+:H+ antiporter subunit F